MPAATTLARRRWCGTVSGNGSAYYYGAVFNVDAATALIAGLAWRRRSADWLELPQPVELCIRAHTADRRAADFSAQLQQRSPNDHAR